MKELHARPLVVLVGINYVIYVIYAIRSSQRRNAMKELHARLFVVVAGILLIVAISMAGCGGGDAQLPPCSGEIDFHPCQYAPTDFTSAECYTNTGPVVQVVGTCNPAPGVACVASCGR
jgi:hypothetical protein